MSAGGWYEPGTPEYARVEVVRQAIEEAAIKVDYDPGAIAGGFISFMAVGWAEQSDADFEDDMAELVNGMRLMRADIQSRGQVKS